MQLRMGLIYYKNFFSVTSQITKMSTKVKILSNPSPFSKPTTTYVLGHNALT